MPWPVVSVEAGALCERGGTPQKREPYPTSGVEMSEVSGKTAKNRNQIVRIGANRQNRQPKGRRHRG